MRESQPRAPAVEQPVVQPATSNMTEFVQQMKLMKDIMTIMLPPTPSTPNVPVPNTPIAREPTFTIETMERLAKMFR